jgi:hypothetical protein
MVRFPTRAVVKEISRWLKYFYWFGLWHGSAILLNLLASSEVTKLQLPDFSAPLFLRKKTSDLATFENIFLERPLGFEFNNFSPDIIIDAGANIGCSTVFLAQRYPKARIYALEAVC